MIISKRCKFIFIHIPKNAGSSISKALSEKIVNYEEKHWALSNKTKHESFLDLKQKCDSLSFLQKKFLDTNFMSYYKFAVVRNPFDRMVSLYHYLKEKGKYSQIHSISKFSEFIHLLNKPNSWVNTLHSTKTQLSYIVDKKGKVAINKICRYEFLEKDLCEIKNKHNISFSLPHINISHHLNYQNYYSSKTIDIVADHFKEDINYFQYKFE